MWHKRIAAMFLYLMLLCGIAILLYPSVSDWINKVNATKAIVQYESAVEQISEEAYEKIWQCAHEYNKTIGGTFVIGEPENKEYTTQLNLSDDGMMGYIQIEKIGVSLPIYHGTAENKLQQGICHLEGSSLPVGGQDTHAILTGHRGLPNARIFTDLDQMVIGDTFRLIILDKVLTYEVDDIKIIEPMELDSLNIVEGEDYVTLVTCTPYAVNTHRLLVRGVRAGLEEIYTGPNVKEQQTDVALQWLAVLSVIAILLCCLKIWIKKRHAMKCIVLFICSLILINNSILKVHAEENQKKARYGRIEIILNDIGTEMARCSFSLYQIGEYKQNISSFILKSEYENMNVDLNKLYMADDITIVTEKLKEIVCSQQPLYSKLTDSKGKVVFEELECGVYLILQDNSGNYGEVLPMLVWLPSQFGTEQGDAGYNLSIKAKGRLLAPSTDPDSVVSELDGMVNTGEEHLFIVPIVLLAVGIFLIHCSFVCRPD